MPTYSCNVQLISEGPSRNSTSSHVVYLFAGAAAACCSAGPAQQAARWALGLAGWPAAPAG
jgi:hypothetical protein